MDDTPQANSSQQPTSPPHVVVAPVYQPSLQKTSWLRRLFVVLLVMGLFGSLALNMLLLILLGLSGLGSLSEQRVQEQFFSHNRQGRDKVAIISIEGTILSGDGFVKRQIDHALKDAKDGRLRAVVVRVNSPGGTITGSDYLLHYLRNLAQETHIPLVVSMGGVAASGGYYVSMCVGDQAESIFAEPTTWTGSIGVIIPHYNLTELLKKWGVEEDAIVSHRLKSMGSIARKMTPEEREIFQGLVNQGFEQFKEVIRQGRPHFRENSTALDKLATGQIFTAQQALENRLIDKIGFLEDAVDRAIQLAGLDREQVKVVKYRAEPGLSDLIFGISHVPATLDLAALLDSTTPRAYYLCTWLPAIAGSTGNGGE